MIHPLKQIASIHRWSVLGWDLTSWKKLQETFDAEAFNKLKAIPGLVEG